MSTELGVLGLYGLVVLLTIFAQVLLAIPQLGLPYLVGPRDQGLELEGAAARLERALGNSVTAMALFAPAVLILVFRDAGTGMTLLAAQAFLVARILYVLVYAAGIPWLRTLIWAVGLLATIYLYARPLIDFGVI